MNTPSSDHPCSSSPINARPGSAESVVFPVPESPKNNANCWLINTGWVAGGYGESSRIRIKWTRALLNAALDGSLDDVIFVEDERFGFHIPTSCEGVPDEILQPRETWADKTRFDYVANLLAQMFIENFEQYSEGCSEEVLSASPKVLE